jgi:SAM-dependent methyltransferase
MLRDLLRRLVRRRAETIVDGERRLGEFGATRIGYEHGLRKEEVARSYILERAGESMRFLDVGGGDGKLEYLLGIRENLDYDARLYDANRSIFDRKYRYSCLDIGGAPEPGKIVADICDEHFAGRHQDLSASFDVVYSNNVFEHLRRPWIAARNIVALLKPGGVAVTIAPFALRYHEVPSDYFRFSHTGLASLFEDTGQVRVLVTGYDITGRRNNWQGGGRHNDICPTDRFGAWRENWFVVTVVERTA